MGRIIIAAALITIGVIAAAYIGTLVEKVQRRLAPPTTTLPRPRGRRDRLRDVAIGLAIMAALVLLGFLIQSPG